MGRKKWNYLPKEIQWFIWLSIIGLLAWIYTNITDIIIFILLLLVLVLLLWWLYKIEESKKYVQEKSLNWFIEIWKYVLTWRRFTIDNILKEVENNINNKLKEEAKKNIINSLTWSIIPMHK